MAVREVKLCLLGESGVGKSSIAVRFVHDNFRAAVEPTIGASFLTKTITVEDTLYKIQIWDTAGQEKYRALAPMYYRGAQAAIIIYDITNEKSWQSLRSWISELKKHGPPNIAIAVAGNKADLDDLREVKYEDALHFAETAGAVFVETSAKTSLNIAMLFHELCKSLSNVDFGAGLGNTSGSSTIQLRHNNEQEQGSRRKCCSSAS